ncbi:PA3715 family protein [Flavobacterium quisquiliarum]|jgi:hypothetical protein|uniref:Uncharacterized protein n=1 Tax=Flavobacterium quisquiliarum TaxID=1834436 RepID=A0ABV8WA28_9FLAO|nr:hypothetical protein [Flavobacterium quisquiliarum]MBW1656630.1 hypothetical protein [Flavobacterium quisquiliarum]NWL03701.1 hypothetical protein [Flavobacterium collinsii]
MTRYLFTLLLCVQFSFSQSADHLNTILKQLKLNESQIRIELFTEKILPYDKNKSVLVIPKYASDIEEGSFVLDAYILVIDNVTGKIIYKFIEPNAWTSDALILTDITIDTGLYYLNKTTRAFGIRADYRTQSQPNPFSETNLSLYIVEKNTLKPVLHNYRVYKYGGEWDMKCDGEFEDIDSTIDIDKLQNNNFNNLIIKTKITKTENTFKNDDCDSKETIKKETTKLIFDGKQYK